MELYIGPYVICKRKPRSTESVEWVDSVTGDVVYPRSMYKFNPLTGNLIVKQSVQSTFKGSVFWDNEKMENLNLDEDTFMSPEYWFGDNDNYELLILNKKTIFEEYFVINTLSEFNLEEFKIKYSKYLKFFEKESDGIEVNYGILNYD